MSQSYEKLNELNERLLTIGAAARRARSAFVVEFGENPVTVPELMSSVDVSAQANEQVIDTLKPKPGQSSSADSDAYLESAYDRVNAALNGEQTVTVRDRSEPRLTHTSASEAPEATTTPVPDMGRQNHTNESVEDFKVDELVKNARDLASSSRS